LFLLGIHCKILIGMNKKQLIVAWMTGVLISIAFVTSPFGIVKEPVYSVYRQRQPTPEEIKESEIKRQHGLLTFDDVPSREKIGENKVIKQKGIIVVPMHLLIRIPPILIIGSLLIYTLRDKKK